MIFNITAIPFLVCFFPNRPKVLHYLNVADSAVLLKLGLDVPDLCLGLNMLM